MALLTQHERHTIEHAIAAAETKTAGELVLAIVPQSHGYSGYRALITWVWSMGIVLCMHHLWPTWSTATILLLQIPIAAIVWPVTGLGVVLRLLLPRHVMQQAVHQRVMQMFADRGVHHTRDASGILVMISEKEHRVVILADRGIHHRVDANHWQRYVDQIIKGIQRHQTHDAVIDVIQHMGALLATHFPRQHDDTNELPNRVIYER